MDKFRKNLCELAVAARLYIEANADLEHGDEDRLTELVAKSAVAHVLFGAISARVNMSLVDDSLDMAHKYKEELRRQTQKIELQTKKRLEEDERKD